MSIDVRRCSTVDELRQALDAISHYFGNRQTEEGAEEFARWIDVERVHAAWDGDVVVGGAGAFSFRVSVPGGGALPTAGVTVVGVLPTHRRRGILTAMMRAQLEDCRARGDAAAYLWASEATIYGRFGYGLASQMGQMKLPHERTSFAVPFEPRGVVRLVDKHEALRAFPPLHEQVFAQHPGMFTRSEAWWETRRLADNPRQPMPPKNFALLEIDGAPAGYAMYKVQQDWRAGSSAGKVEIQEALAPTPEGTRELWRWLLDFDWTSRFEAGLLPLDHPLFLLLAEPRRMQFEVNDGVWVRVIDIPAAFGARAYAGEGSVVVEVTDAFLPENSGRWRLGPEGVERTDAAADLALDVTGLGSVYLGGFTFGDLVRGSRAAELSPAAAARADALFGRWSAPWCPEIF